MFAFESESLVKVIKDVCEFIGKADGSLTIPVGINGSIPQEVFVQLIGVLKQEISLLRQQHILLSAIVASLPVSINEEVLERELTETLELFKKRMEEKKEQKSNIVIPKKRFGI